jgi:hypothetical protein
MAEKAIGKEFRRYVFEVTAGIVCPQNKNIFRQPHLLPNFYTRG